MAKKTKPNIQRQPRTPFELAVMDMQRLDFNGKLALAKATSQALGNTGRLYTQGEVDVLVRRAIDTEHRRLADIGKRAKFGQLIRKVELTRP